LLQEVLKFQADAGMTPDTPHFNSPLTEVHSNLSIALLGCSALARRWSSRFLASHPKVFAGRFGQAAQLCGLAGTPLRFADAVPAVAGAQLREPGTAYLERIGAAAPEPPKTLPINCRRTSASPT